MSDTDPKADELKPCPFCGDTLVHIQDSVAPAWAHPVHRPRSQCIMNGTVIRLGNLDAWNTRTPTPAPKLPYDVMPQVDLAQPPMVSGVYGTPVGEPDLMERAAKHAADNPMPAPDAYYQSIHDSAEKILHDELRVAGERITELKAALEDAVDLNDVNAVRIDGRKERLATARNEALDEAKAGCAEYQKSHEDVMKQHGNSDYHVSCSAAAGRCLDIIEGLKTEQEDG